MTEPLQVYEMENQYRKAKNDLSTANEKIYKMKNETARWKEDYIDMQQRNGELLCFEELNKTQKDTIAAQRDTIDALRIRLEGK